MMGFSRANNLKAIIYFFFSRKKYLRMAIYHSIAISLESVDLRKLYEEGKFPEDGWEANYLNDVKNSAKNVDRAIAVSFLYIFTVAFIALLIATAQGRVHYSLNFDFSLLSIFVGTFLTSWATLMALGENMRTWSGEALHELIHPIIFKIIFIPGTLLILAGTIS
ncbi:hypothetical protein FED29_013770 [Aeromonas veronii]|nr:hypothetical protein [Aeromonas veronii]